MKIQNLFLPSFFGLFVSAFINAQDFKVEKTDTSGLYRLSDVVITATRTETHRLEIASSISVIDSSEIANKNAFNVSDLLKDEYGLNVVQQGGPGKLQSVFMRGANSGHTLVLINDIEMNIPSDALNTFDFSSLSIDNIERVEILRGPQSTLYGSDALAGVINIITKKGGGKPKFYISGEGGSYNTYKGTAGLNGSYKFINYSVAAGRYKTDGFSSASNKYGNTEKDGTENNNIISSLGFKVSDNFKLNLYYRFNEANADYDQTGGTFGDDPTYIYNLEESSFRTEGNLSILEELWDQKLGFSYFRNVRKYSYDSTFNNPSSSRSFYDGRKIKFDWQNNLNFSEKYKLILGLETEQEKANTEYYIYSSAFPFQSILPSNETRTSGVYLENQLNFFDSFFSTAGLRYDHHQRFGSKLTYRLTGSYIIWRTGTKFKATIGTGFKAPSLYYLFDPAYGNEELKPEESIGWDAGIDQYFGNYLTIGATYFQNSFDHLFGFDNNFRTINIGKAKTNGVELYANIFLLNDITLKLNYTYTNAVDKSNSADRDSPLLRRPEHKAGFNINYNILENLNTNVSLIYTGKRDDKDFSVFPVRRVKLEPYILINFAASYRLVQFLQLNCRIENVLDAEYEEVLGYATPGLSAYAGIKFSF